MNLSGLEANCSKNALASSFVIELPHFLFITYDIVKVSLPKFDSIDYAFIISMFYLFKEYGD
jgi:hypothetical protein